MKHHMTAAKQATPHATLIEELLDSRVPKTEREHAAAREIEKLKASLSDERELIAAWVADMCQGLDASTIAEAIRNGGNDAMDNFKVK
jgi:hypothetical protein